MAKRRVLLVDDEVSILLTVKTVLEISGFEVDTAASAVDAKLKLKRHEYDMVITDMRMEHDASGREVILAARSAPYHPAVALLTALPFSEEDWQEMGADKMLVKPMQTASLIRQLEQLLEKHTVNLAKSSGAPATVAKPKLPKKVAPAKKAAVTKKVAAKKTVKKSAAKRLASRKLPVKKAVAKKVAAKKTAVKKRAIAKKAVAKKKTKR